MQVQNFALARKKIVFDVEPVHGLEMAAQHRHRNQIGDGGSLRRRILNGVQGLQAHLQILLVLRVPLRNAGIQIPAVIVEARLPGQRLDLRARFLLDVREADHHVGHLHARVVDVVLNVDFPARKTQQPDKCVAENGVAQVSDVRSFVGIDARVLDQNLAGRNLGRRLLVGGEGSSHPSPVDPDVQIAGRRNLHFGDAFDGTDLGPDGFGNLQRRRAQWLGERKNRNREVPEFDLRRLFHDHAGQGRAGIRALQTLQHALGKTMFQMTIQEVPLS